MRRPGRGQRCCDAESGERRRRRTSFRRACRPEAWARIQDEETEQIGETLPDTPDVPFFVGHGLVDFFRDGEICSVVFCSLVNRRFERKRTERETTGRSDLCIWQSRSSGVPPQRVSCHCRAGQYSRPASLRLVLAAGRRSPSGSTGWRQPQRTREWESEGLLEVSRELEEQMAELETRSGCRGVRARRECGAASERDKDLVIQKRLTECEAGDEGVQPREREGMPRMPQSKDKHRPAGRWSPTASSSRSLTAAPGCQTGRRRELGATENARSKTLLMRSDTTSKDRHKLKQPQRRKPGTRRAC